MDYLVWLNLRKEAKERQLVLQLIQDLSKGPEFLNVISKSPACPIYLHVKPRFAILDIFSSASLSR